MICSSCAVAGDIIRQYREDTENITRIQHEQVKSQTILPFARQIETVAKFFHGRCHPSNCDCQHKIDWLGGQFVAEKVASNGSGPDNELREESNDGEQDAE